MSEDPEQYCQEGWDFGDEEMYRSEDDGDFEMGEDQDMEDEADDILGESVGSGTEEIMQMSRGSMELDCQELPKSDHPEVPTSFGTNCDPGGNTTSMGCVSNTEEDPSACMVLSCHGGPST